MILENQAISVAISNPPPKGSSRAAEEYPIVRRAPKSFVPRALQVTNTTRKPTDFENTPSTFKSTAPTTNGGGVSGTASQKSNADFRNLFLKPNPPPDLKP